MLPIGSISEAMAKRMLTGWAANGEDGGATGARTPDLLHAMQMLSQLSYRPSRGRKF